MTSILLYRYFTHCSKLLQDHHSPGVYVLPSFKSLHGMYLCVGSVITASYRMAWSCVCS